MSVALGTMGQGTPDTGDNDSQPCLTDGGKDSQPCLTDWWQGNSQPCLTDGGREIVNRV